jgi:hypothetical protein
MPACQAATLDLETPAMLSFGASVDTLLFTFVMRGPSLLAPQRMHSCSGCQQVSKRPSNVESMA